MEKELKMEAQVDISYEKTDIYPEDIYSTIKSILDNKEDLFDRGYEYFEGDEEGISLIADFPIEAEYDITMERGYYMVPGSGDRDSYREVEEIYPEIESCKTSWYWFDEVQKEIKSTLKEMGLKKVKVDIYKNFSEDSLSEMLLNGIE